MLEYFPEYYRKTDGETKKKILVCIYAGKLVLELRAPTFATSFVKASEIKESHSWQSKAQSSV